MTAVYTNFEGIKNGIKQSKYEKSKQFFIVSKKWIEYLNRFYDYDKVIFKLKENEDFKEYLNQLIKERNNKDNKETNSTENTDLNKPDEPKKGNLENILKQIFPNEYLEFLNKENLDSSEINLEINLEKLKLNKDNEEISFYKEFFIINKNIKKLFNNIYKIDSEEKYFIPIDFLIKENTNYIFYSLTEKYLINIGKFNEDLIFETNIIIDVENQKYGKNNLIEEIIINDVQTFVNNLVDNTSMATIDIMNKNNEKVGTAYKIEKIGQEENNDIKPENNTIIEEMKVKNDIINLIKICLFNIDLYNKIYLSESEISNEQNNFEKKVFIGKYFLINREYMDSYKDYYSYSELEKKFYEYIEKNDTIQKDSEGNLFSNENIDIVYDLFTKNEFFEKYKVLETYKNEKIKTDIKITKINNNENIFYYDDFIVVNEEIYKYFNSSFNIIKYDCECIINSGKIIIFYEEGETYKILIGELLSNCINLNILIILKNNTQLTEFKKKLLKENYQTLIDQLKQNKGEENVSIFELPGEKINKIKSLAEIYTIIERLKYRIHESKFDSAKNFLIVNKKWIEYLNKFYNYDKVIDEFKKNEEFNSYVEDYKKKEFQMKSKQQKEEIPKKNKISYKRQRQFLDSLTKSIYENENLETIFIMKI